MFSLTDSSGSGAYFLSHWKWLSAESADSPVSQWRCLNWFQLNREKIYLIHLIDQFCGKVFQKTCIVGNLSWVGSLHPGAQFNSFPIQRVPAFHLQTKSGSQKILWNQIYFNFFWNSIFVRKCITSTKFCCSTRLVIWATQWHEAVWTRLHLMSSILSQIWFHPTLPTFTFLCRLLCSSGRIDGRSFSLLNCLHCPELLPSVCEIYWFLHMVEQYEWNVNATCRQSSWKVFTSPKRLQADTRSDGGSTPFSTWPINLGCGTYLSFQNPDISMFL